MCVPIFYVGGIKNKEEGSTTAANTIATSSGEYGLQILRRWVFQRVFIYPFRTLQPLVAVFYLPIAYDDDVRADLLHISLHNSSTVDREKCTCIL